MRPGFHGGQRLRCASLAQTGRIDEARQFSSWCERTAATLGRLDQGERALSDAGTDGALSGGHAKGGFNLIESRHLGRLRPKPKFRLPCPVDDHKISLAS